MKYKVKVAYRGEGIGAYIKNYTQAVPKTPTY